MKKSSPVQAFINKYRKLIIDFGSDEFGSNNNAIREAKKVNRPVIEADILDFLGFVVGRHQ